MVFAAILPLTGNSAEQGEWVRHGLTLAADETNHRSGRPIRFVFEDSQGGNASVAISAYQNLKLRDTFPAVFTWGSGVGLALTPVNEDEIVQTGLATSTPRIRRKMILPFKTTLRRWPRASM
ncbi:hypothetical protein COV04_00255 [Candidatus Uhrbacteria bacterium CG10_big_fil_rev_8_21_14_0_10_48_11]|uniref:Leucine-binding protein domain-containing protein n=1 Tax=Candidatus Uhrbacteria bacterium CG10_big_fil_rev_8_21_14_0_10_48_11 TaxID=1975037 RepID=A0A2M8LFS0_9BACT|nr:MAG: hypothetical protein COV04_00255 [Candidatus Uhrbacteria bacterium CG10_big_fil_rev_8_21_14_0_10_48_11]